MCEQCASWEEFSDWTRKYTKVARQHFWDLTFCLALSTKEMLIVRWGHNTNWFKATILCCEIAWCAHLNKTLLKLPSSLNEAKLRLLLSSSFLLLQQQQQQIVVRCVQTPNRAAYITADHFGRPKFATMLLLSCSKSGRREEEEERKLFMTT
jgi:hypothetical protein